MAKNNRIAILTGGGDCPGINAVIRAVAKKAILEHGAEVIGIEDGYDGLVRGKWRKLEYNDVSGILTLGGTILGTSNAANPYRYPVKRKGRLEFQDLSRTAIKNAKSLNMDCLVCIGGDGTMHITSNLFQDGVPVVGIPKTIDKDLPETDYTLGFETALNVITEEIDRLRTTAGSHKRIFVVETMGRHAGWLALEGGEPSGAFIILIPEYDFSLDKVNELVLEGRRGGARYDIVVVAEGAKPLGDTEFVRQEGVDSFGHKFLGGVGDFLAREIQEATKVETRSINLSHLQRGGAPCAYDRRMGRYFGIAAMDLVAMGHFGKMVCVRNGKISACPIANTIGRPQFVDVDTQYDVERYNGRRTILRTLEKKPTPR